MSSRSEILNTCCRGAAQSVLTVQEAVIKIQFPQGALCNMFCLLCALRLALAHKVCSVKCICQHATLGNVQT